MNQLPRSINEHLTYLQQKGMPFPDKEAAIDLFSRGSNSRLKYYWRDLIDEDSDGDFKGRRNVWLNGELSELQKKKPYAVICAIAYLCKAVNPYHSFANSVKHLCTEYPNIALSKYGFPVRWEKEPLWR